MHRTSHLLESALLCVFARMYDVTQEASLSDVINWGREGLKLESNAHAANVQWDSIAVAGHSRGGTIAYHQLQIFPDVKAAVLLDPVREPTRSILPTHKPLFVIGARVMYTLSGGGSRCCPVCVLGWVGHLSRLRLEMRLLYAPATSRVAQTPPTAV